MERHKFLVVLAYAWCVSAILPSVARADCTSVALRAATGFKDVHRAVLMVAGQERELQPRKDCLDNRTCVSLVFATEKVPTPPVAPDGFQLGEGDGWTKVNSDTTCAQLFVVTFKSKGSSPAPGKPGNGGDRQTSVAAKAVLEAEDMSKALAGFKGLRQEKGVTREPLGAAQADAAGIASEALQIAGQMVVDRASAKAYRLLQAKLKELLHCAEKVERLAGQLPPLDFPATCAVLDSVRPQDIAMDPDVLFAALFKDAASRLGANWSASLGGAYSTAVRPLLFRRDAAQDAMVRGIQAALEAEVASIPSEVGMSAAQTALAAGVLAFSHCLASGGRNSLTSCSVGAVVERLVPAGEGADAIRTSARTVASNLVSLFSAVKIERAQVVLAVDTLFATQCMLHSGAAELSCPGIEELKALATPIDRIAMLKAAVDAAIEPNAMQLVVVAAKLVELTTPQGASEQDADGATDRRRALALLGALLDYTATYAKTASGSQDEAAAHEKRTRILESVTRDMSDRTARDGDWIVSLGGALRLTGGVRVGVSSASGSHAFYGPLGLPLGVAVTQASPKGCGFHAELDAVDLGNYLALDNKPAVKEPEVGDVLAPSLMLGVACGGSDPFVIGPTLSYTPQFALDAADSSKHGSLNIGFVLGVHVPLIDMN